MFVFARLLHRRSQVQSHIDHHKQKCTVCAYKPVRCSSMIRFQNKNTLPNINSHPHVIYQTFATEQHALPASQHTHRLSELTQRWLLAPFLPLIMLEFTSWTSSACLKQSSNICSWRPGRRWRSGDISQSARDQNLGFLTSRFWLPVYQGTLLSDLMLLVSTADVFGHMWRLLYGVLLFNAYAALAALPCACLRPVRETSHADYSLIHFIPYHTSLKLEHLYMYLWQQLSHFF